MRKSIKHFSPHRGQSVVHRPSNGKSAGRCASVVYVGSDDYSLYALDAAASVE